LLDKTRSEVSREYYAWILGEIGNFAGLVHLEAAAAQDPDGWLGECAREASARIRGL
jgi:hypothetical protein